MDILNIALSNCYGINKLEYEFDFSANNGRSKSYAIYAPNGLMKTSFSRTFENLANGQLPSEERYNRVSSCAVKNDGEELKKDNIYVIKSDIDSNINSNAITNILVDPAKKTRYDEILIDLDKLKNKLIASLSKNLTLKKSEIESTLLMDWKSKNFPHCIEMIQSSNSETQEDLSKYDYSIIFDPKAIEVLESKEFISKAAEFNERYQDLFIQSGTIYRKGVFNPAKAETSFNTLGKQGFFATGHRVHFSGENSSIDQVELEKKLLDFHKKIDEDETLKKIRSSLAKNIQTQSLMNLIEELSLTEIDFLLDKLSSKNREQFKKDLWIYHIKIDNNALSYTEAHSQYKDELRDIETQAAEAVPRWTKAVELFNDRFVNMPFTLSIRNPVQAALGQQTAELIFTFSDAGDTVEWSRSQIKTLSQGEKRALYLLNFIFEVESRKSSEEDTLFIIDDIADSFDYKNKHAIIQYLEDITKTSNFHQIILTHNFDFFRTLAINFVHRDRCLMANRGASEIQLSKAEGIKNYFIGKWKENVTKNDIILCATIPFARNIIEYTKGEKDPDYLKLTSLLHWKSDTEDISVGNYLEIYNRTFNTNHDTKSKLKIKNLLFLKAEEISIKNEYLGLNLEDKVLLSIAIRLKAEIFITNDIRKIKMDENYWCEANSQFGHLERQYSTLVPITPSHRVIEKISITVSSNIHLNSFMYEPILDLTIDHLVKLYNEVKNLQ